MLGAANSIDQVRKLLSSNGDVNDFFGFSVSVSGNLALVAASSSGPGSFGGIGSAYVYNLETDEELFELTASDRKTGDRFGWSAALDGNIAVVGDIDDEDNGNDAGSAHIFDVTTGEELFKIKPEDGKEKQFFGISVGISGHIAVIGAVESASFGSTDSGSAYLFDVQSGKQLYKLVPSDGAGADQFGTSVSISGNLVAVGAEEDDDLGDKSGSVYIFDATSGEELFKLQAKRRSSRRPIR